MYTRPSGWNFGGVALRTVLTAVWFQSRTAAGERLAAGLGLAEDDDAPSITAAATAPTAKRLFIGISSRSVGLAAREDCRASAFAQTLLGFAEMRS
jgi:hypothetical protein